MNRSVLALLLALPLVTGVASPALAVDATADMCTDMNYQVVDGTTITFTFDGTCRLRSVGEGNAGSVRTPNDNAAASEGSLIVTIANAGEFLVVRTRNRPLDIAYRQVVFGCDVVYTGSNPVTVIGECPPKPIAVDVPAPTPWMQGLPLPASGVCADVDTTALGATRAIEGGWRRGWEPWANPAGPEGDRWGWACIRTLVPTASGWAPQQ